MLTEHPVCRARFVTARSVTAKCYGLVNLCGVLEGSGGGYMAVALEARWQRSRSGPLPKTFPAVTGHTVLQGHGVRRPTRSWARRPTETALGWCRRLEGGLFWCEHECAVDWPMQSVVAGMGTQPHWNPSDTSFAVKAAPTSRGNRRAKWLWGDIGNVVTLSQFVGMILVLLVTSRV